MEVKKQDSVAFTSDKDVETHEKSFFIEKVELDVKSELAKNTVNVC
jgi:hypothetical protein